MTPSLLLSGRYRVVARIGQGGMSEVWQAIDEVLDRPVAIKVLGPSNPSPPDPAGPDPDPSEVIRAEAQAAARLAHPNVASVYDYGVAEDESGQRIAYIVMELLSGQSLGERLGEGPVPAGTALRIMSEVAAALGAAHAIGVVHRDVKPGNIMLTPFGAKVFDFGIAASAGDMDHGDSRGRILGTPTYVAPERLAGARVTPAADMYAFGVLLTRLFEDPATTPTEIERLRLRCLAADPGSRPTAPEAHAVLATRVAGLSVYNGRTVSLPVPVPAAVPAAAGGLPPTGYLPPPLHVTFHRPARRPVRRWSLVATALLLAAAGLSCLAVAVEHGTRASNEVTLPNPAPTPSRPAPAAPAQPEPQATPRSSANAAGDDNEDGYAAAISSACETEAQRRNEVLTRLARLHAHGHKVTLNASVVCRNGIPVLQLTR